MGCPDDADAVGTARTGAVEAPERPSRDPWFDNTRALAAVLVTLGHVLPLVTMDPATFDALWTGTWPFRIPAYVFLAGWFTSPRALNLERFGALVRDVFVVYLVFASIHVLQGRQGRGEGWLTDFTHPPLGTWFLLSLFTWRLMLPLLSRVRGLFWWALAASLLGGWITTIGWEYSASHTLAMFPLFVLGSQMARSDLRDAIATPAARRLAGLFVLGSVLLFGFASGGRLSNWGFAMNDPYTLDIYTPTSAGMPLRAGLLVMGALGAVALMTLVPRRRLPYVTYLGTGSMYVYLLHMIVVVELDRRDALKFADTGGEILFIVAATVLSCALLASPPVRAVFRPLVQPRTVDWRNLLRTNTPLNR